MTAVGSRERRAVLARLSLFLLPVVVMAASLGAASVAQAAPPVPALTGTTPASPNTSLTPSVHGSSSGVIISSFPGVQLHAVTSGGELEGRTVLLYLNATCQGSPAAEGTAEALNTTGIQVTVPTETTTSISAKQKEGEEASGCSNAIQYQQVKELPPPPEEGSGGGTSSPPGTAPSEGVSPAAPAGPLDPPRLHMIPGGLANDSTPEVAGSAPGATLVKIFASSTCGGEPVARGTAAQLGAGIPVQVAANALSVFSALSVASGGGQSKCSAPVSYTEDSLAPRVRITMGPAAKTRKRKAVFRFTDTTGDAPGTTFSCRVNRAKWRTCVSPLRLRHLRARHSYTVKVKATDPAGNVSAKAAKRRFKVI